MRPVAEHIAAAQEQADLANYNRRFDSGKQVADAMERLQPRGPLPPVPTLEPGGSANLWRHTPVVVTGPPAVELVDAVVEKVADSLTDRLPDLPPTDDPVLARLRAWKPQR